LFQADIQTDGRMDMTHGIDDFRIYANAPKNSGPVLED